MLIKSSSAAAVLSLPAKHAAGLPSGSASALQPSEHRDPGGAGQELQTLHAQAAILPGHGDSHDLERWLLVQVLLQTHHQLSSLLPPEATIGTLT